MLLNIRSVHPFLSFLPAEDVFNTILASQSVGLAWILLWDDRSIPIYQEEARRGSGKGPPDAN